MNRTTIYNNFGGRVALSAGCEGHIETTSFNQIKNNLKRFGLDTPRRASTTSTAPLSATGLLDQRSSL